MHSLILGLTESGKTTLAKRLTRDLLNRQSIKSIVLDPKGDIWPYSEFVTKDPSEFLYIAKRSTCCALFVDEAGDNCKNWDYEIQWTAKQSRAWGHSAFFIGQDYFDVAKKIRGQCGSIFLFQTYSKKDRETIASEWGEEKFLEADTLAQGEYFYKVRFQEIKRFNLF